MPRRQGYPMHLVLVKQTTRSFVLTVKASAKATPASLLKPLFIIRHWPFRLPYRRIALAIALTVAVAVSFNPPRYMSSARPLIRQRPCRISLATAIKRSGVIVKCKIVPDRICSRFRIASALAREVVILTFWRLVQADNARSGAPNKCQWMGCNESNHWY
jgi:hypothetical protein